MVAFFLFSQTPYPVHILLLIPPFFDMSGGFKFDMIDNKEVSFMDFTNPMYAGCMKPGSTCGGSDVSGSGCSSCEGHFTPCKRGGWALKDYPLAMVYSPYQTFGGLYDACKGLKQGTLFKELDLPFEGKGNGSCKGKGCCR